MKTNRLREVLARKEVPIGHMIVDFNVRGMAKMLEVAGLDFVIIDMEHGAFSHDDVADLVAWFKATPLAVFVRIPIGTYPFIARILDTGAQGIMVPNVKTAAYAREIVQAAKYPPDGGRGLTFSSAVNDYEPVPNALDYNRNANRETTIICQIEHESAISQLDEIAAVPGVDVLWIGQYDLTNSMGIPGEFENPRFINAFQSMTAAAHRHGKFAGVQVGSEARMKEWFPWGVDVLSFSDDSTVYLEAIGSGVKQIRRGIASLKNEAAK